MKDLMRIARLSMLYKNEMMKDTDITGGDTKYIMCVCNNNGITQDEIASKMDIDKSNVARRLSELEKKGYIERKVKKEDKRNLEVYPTKKALDAYPFVCSIIREWNDYLTEDLTEEEKESFNVILSKIREKAEKRNEHKFSEITFPQEMIKG